MKDLNNFVKERDEALLSLDKEKILTFMGKYGIPNKVSSDLVFWAGIHKAILQLNSATVKQKQKSFDWLIGNGFKPYIELGKI